jgi:hypothetical protein
MNEIKGNKDIQFNTSLVIYELKQNNKKLITFIKHENEALNARLDRIEDRIDQIIASQQYQH